MKKFVISVLAISLSCCFSMGFAQVGSEKPLMTIGDEAVSKAEFVNTFAKNNDLKKTTDKELRDYLDLFVNFKLGKRRKIAKDRYLCRFPGRVGLLY